MAFSEKVLFNIMSCKGYICAASNHYDEIEIIKDLEQVEQYLENFEKNFSRFLPYNQLYNFNNSAGDAVVSNELYEMLLLSSKYFTDTDGVFDISILNNLKNEGYVLGKDSGFKDNKYTPVHTSAVFKELKIISQNNINKPLNLKVDLGGIGKGYAIDKCHKYLSKKYTNYCVEIGGDMYLGGVDTQNDYEYWAINVENPAEPEKSICTLIVKNAAIATSGINKRHWVKNGITKNHLIDSKTGTSVNNNILSVTVVADTTTDADIQAKSALLMGLENGLKYCNNNKIAGIFVDSNLTVYYSNSVKQYVWKE